MDCIYFLDGRIYGKEWTLKSLDDPSTFRLRRKIIEMNCQYDFEELWSYENLLFIRIKNEFNRDLLKVMRQEELKTIF